MKIRRTKKQLAGLRAYVLDDLVGASADAVVARLIAQCGTRFVAGDSADVDVVMRVMSALDVTDDALRLGPTSWRGHRGKAPAVSAEAKALAVVRRKLLALLGGLGVQRVDPVGQRVDFVLHEPAIVVPTLREDEDGVVSETLRAGYTSAGGKTFRAAIVAVLKYETKPSRTTKQKGS